MPQVELSSSKGLNQKSGQGFADSDLATISSTLDIGAAGTTAQKGALVHLVDTTAGAVNVTLFSAAEGAVKGQTKIFLVSAGTNALTIKNSAGTDIATGLDAVGNFAICVFDGSEWVAGVSNVA
jgi:hypothetical protein